MYQQPRGEGWEGGREGDVSFALTDEVNSDHLLQWFSIEIINNQVFLLTLINNRMSQAAFYHDLPALDWELRSEEA